MRDILHLVAIIYPLLPNLPRIILKVEKIHNFFFFTTASVGLVVLSDCIHHPHRPHPHHLAGHPSSLLQGRHVHSGQEIVIKQKKVGLKIDLSSSEKVWEYFLLRRERRVTIIMGTITLSFLVCVWPYAVIFMKGESFIFGKNNGPTLQKVVTLMYLNSLINPILYICINKQVRKAIVKMFTCQEQEMHDT